MPNTLLNSTELIDMMEEEFDSQGFVVNSPLSYANSAFNPVKTAITRVNDRVVGAYNRYILEFATGEDLAEKVAEFGVSRQSPTAPADSTFTNFNVYFLKGVSRDYLIDKYQNLVIPKDNVTISDTDGYSYTITEDLVFEPNAFSAYTPIVASSTTKSVISVNTITVVSIRGLENLTNVDLTKLEDMQFGCTNAKAIIATTRITTDVELRNQAFLRIHSMNNTNEDAILLALRTYGITDVTFKRDMYGFGTIGVLVKINGSALISETTASTLDSVIRNVCPTAKIVLPEFLIVNMSISATFDDETLIDQTKAQIFTDVTSYFTNLEIGQGINSNSIQDIIRRVSNVENATVRCIKVDGRMCILGMQRALADQLFVLSANTPISYSV